MTRITCRRPAEGGSGDGTSRSTGLGLRLTSVGLAVLGALCIVVIGVLGPRSAAVSAAVHGGAHSGGQGGIEGDEIIATVDGGVDGGGSASPNPDRCTWRAVTQADPSTGARTEVTRRIGAKSQVLMNFDCLGPPARSGRKWITRVSTTGGASARRRLPAPDVSTAPTPGRGIVNVGTWFWVSRSVWKPWSVTATVATPAGPVTVTTTARPTRLVLDPGDGSRPVRCAGPGRPWNAAYGDGTRSECMYTWRRASTTLPGAAYRASLSIEWRVTWRSSLGASGRLPDIRTSTPFLAQIREIQAVASR